MKNSITLLLSLMLSAPLMAQQTITASWIPGQGTTYKVQKADSTGINHGASGQNVTWDFSGLTEVGSEITQDFVNPSGKPGASSFPNANLAVNMENEEGLMVWHYFESNGNAFNLHGYSSNDGELIFSDALVTMLFPINPGGTPVTDDFIGMLENGTDKIKRHGSYSIVSDGYGTLKLPNATFNYVHKMKAVKTYTDSVFLANIFVSANTTTITRYFWITSNVKQILLNIEYLDSDVTGTDKNVSFFDGPNTQGIGENEALNLKAYPNPASTELYLSLDALTGDRFDAIITDTRGVKVLNTTLDRQNPILNLNMLSAGIYVVQVRDEEGRMAVTKIVVD